jgi:single-strand DNA-binding protein
MNKQIFIGHVGKDAEIKEIKGSNYACFDLASSETRNGEKRITWIQIRKKDPEGKLAPYIKKGTCIYAEGIPTVSAYLNKENTPCANTTIWAEKIEFCSSPQQSQSQTPVQQPVATAKPASSDPFAMPVNNQVPSSDPFDVNDDLPF